MKRALYFAIIYIASLFVGTLIFATLFMFSCNLSMFVTGLPVSVFSLRFFTAGIFTVFPLVCIITQILFVLYLIRHPSSQIISLILYAVFGAISWLVLIPVNLNLASRYETDIVSTRIEASSEGVFRKDDNGVFYYSRIDDDGMADGLFIDTMGIHSQEITVTPFFGTRIQNESAFPYSDILIKNALQAPAVVTYPLAVYNALLTSAHYASSHGFLAWLSFASLGLALLSIYGFQFASSWKLANVSFVLLSACVISFVNYLYYMNILPEILREVGTKLASLTGANDALIVLVNFVISALLIVFGVFMGLYRFGTAISDSGSEE